MVAPTPTPVPISVAAADAFFTPTLGLWKQPPSPTLAAALADAPPVQPHSGSVFTSSDAGLISCILVEEEVSPDLQKALNEQKENLISLCGVGSAYVRTQADKQKNPNLVYNTGIWQEVFNHLPLMGPSEFTRQTYDETMHGVQIASSFIQMIMGFAVSGGAALTSFASFLQGLGDSIRAGVKKTHKSFSTAAITIVLQTQKIGNEVQLIPMLKGYFIDFAESQSEIYSNCASYESFHMKFDYRVAQTVFNFEALKNPDVNTKFSTFLHKNQIDDISNADNFFNASFTPQGPTT